jgi:hypothetical protein
MGASAPKPPSPAAGELRPAAASFGVTSLTVGGGPPPSPAQRELARRLLEDEAGGHRDPAIVARAAEETFRKLRDRLVDLIGVGGFAALLRRALKLAGAELPALERVELVPGGSLGGLRDAIEARTEGDATALPVCLLAHFLHLLATFIGEDLALRLALGAPRTKGDRASEET